MSSLPIIHTPVLLRVLYVLIYISTLTPFSLAPYISSLLCNNNELFRPLFTLTLGLGETDIAPNRLEHCIKVFVISLVCWRQLGTELPPIIDQDFTLHVRGEVSVRKNVLPLGSGIFLIECSMCSCRFWLFDCFQSSCEVFHLVSDCFLIFIRENSTLPSSPFCWHHSMC